MTRGLAPTFTLALLLVACDGGASPRDAGPAGDAGPLADATAVDAWVFPDAACFGCPPPNPFTEECRARVDAMDGVAVTFAGTWSAGLYGPGEVTIEPSATMDLVYGFQGGSMLYPLYFVLDAGEPIPECVEVIAEITVRPAGMDPTTSSLEHYPYVQAGAGSTYLDGLRHPLPYVFEDSAGSPLEIRLRLRTERGEQTFAFGDLVLGSINTDDRI